MSLNSRIRRLIGWGALALYAATTSLCHLAHDPAAHGLACCDHAPRYAAWHEHVTGDDDAICDRAGCDHGHDHAHHAQCNAHDASHEHAPAGDRSRPAGGTPSHDGHSCIVCQFLADPSLLPTFAVELAPTGMVSTTPIADPLAAPQAIGSSYSSRAPPAATA